ncbi:TIGR04086 family membrane protein [Bacillus cereus]|uniref:TIGR04086 family membrane protein n=1 Tax=Bacillus arachidis TaxID=2819290 RepID=A0ABS3NZN3_9BACI|nr:MULTISPECIES: TIGR04086 family membrane protein [Bacillus]PGY04950.1 TIGR04086 family membrane protein [Bacillus cereus]MBO1626389.1 TIGR04086 family membrane protein [Bacillus arachidis]PFE01157.1 TIGR04086 family membrane protein [Bacillus sp. AFS023182]WIY60424.1 TIGR04086 family membrane protein [Bacillus arachidis]SDY54380.1 putative membrane protein, TIGR04086 family [Bacillus sp. 166amftsu]
MDGTKKLSIAIGFGIITLLLLASITSMVIALLLKFTNINEGTLAIALFILALLSMLISGFIAGKKAQGKGWFVGFTTGLTFTILVFLVNYLGFSHALSNSQLLYQLGLMGASTLGGIFGVNMTKRTN